jgi:hypothetical protein
LQVELRALQLRLVLGALGDRLVERRLVWRLINLRHDIPLLHLLALAGRKCHEHAVDLGPHLDGIEGLDRSDTVEIDRNVLNLCLFDTDRHGRRGRRFRRGLGLVRPVQHLPAASTDGNQHNDADDPKADPLHLVLSACSD